MERLAVKSLSLFFARRGIFPRKNDGIFRSKGTFRHAIKLYVLSSRQACSHANSQQQGQGDFPSENRRF